MVNREVPDTPYEQSILEQHGLVARRIAAPFPIWLVKLDNSPRGPLLGCLSEAERARADRFRHVRHRDRYLAAHGALRLLNELHFGIPAARQRYHANAFGKPYLADAGDAYNSISYTGDLALVASSRGEEIGVDAELIRPIEDAQGLMRLHYTQREQRSLERIGARSPRFDQSFLAIWARKEACAKALGRGLSIPPSSFECGATRGRLIVAVCGELVCSEVLAVDGNLVIAWAKCRPYSSNHVSIT